MPPDDLLRSLQQLKPVTPTLNRDQLLFDAGRRSVRHSMAWPMATMASLLLACASFLLHWQQPAQQPSLAQEPVPSLPEIVVQQTKEEQHEVLSPFSYLTLREAGFPKPRHVPSDGSYDIKPMPILTAGSYASPDWIR